MFEKQNPKTDLNVLYIKEMEICPVYVSKINSKINKDCEKQIILLKIPMKKKKTGIILQ